MRWRKKTKGSQLVDGAVVIENGKFYLVRSDGQKLMSCDGDEDMAVNPDSKYAVSCIGKKILAEKIDRQCTVVFDEKIVMVIGPWQERGILGVVLGTTRNKKTSSKTDKTVIINFGTNVLVTHQTQKRFF